jgi:hypothetical protein
MFVITPPAAQDRYATYPSPVDEHVVTVGTAEAVQLGVTNGVAKNDSFVLDGVSRRTQLFPCSVRECRTTRKEC